MTFEQFQYAFVNDLPEAVQQDAYDTYVVPESRRVARATTTASAAIDYDEARGPLLVIAGGTDHIIPASLNYTNYKQYGSTPGISDYKMFPERNHWTILYDGWESVADYSLEWIANNRALETESE